jgi:cytidyltransferase-like protein
MKTVMVSGCYDLLHAGHVRFFEQARTLGDRLVVVFASDHALWLHKRRKPSLPQGHRRILLEALQPVDAALPSTGAALGRDFEPEMRELRPAVLAVTGDDCYEEAKRALCTELDCEYAVLPKDPPACDPVSTTELVAGIKAVDDSPLRVDFAGGWLDVPALARPEGRIVNLTIAPCVSLAEWPYRRNSGLGGSAAWALINGRNPIDSELGAGVGWQDPAAIMETGLCVWESSDQPRLLVKVHPGFLRGVLALLWTGRPHVAADLVGRERDYEQIVRAGRIAAEAVVRRDLRGLGDAIDQSYAAQLDEGMDRLPDAGLARKYCGSGHGGYAVYLFAGSTERDAFVAGSREAMAIDPFERWDHHGASAGRCGS